MQYYIDLYTHTDLCMSVYIYTYVVGMSMNAMGMSIHPFQWNFYVFAGKYFHYLIFDDVIMVHH